MEHLHKTSPVAAPLAMSPQDPVFLSWEDRETNTSDRTLHSHVQAGWSMDVQHREKWISIVPQKQKAATTEMVSHFTSYVTMTSTHNSNQVVLFQGSVCLCECAPNLLVHRWVCSLAQETWADPNPETERRTLPGPDVNSRPLVKTLHKRWHSDVFWVDSLGSHLSPWLFLLTGSLFCGDRLAHTVGILGNDSHQVIGSWPQLPRREGPPTGRHSLLQGKRRRYLLRSLHVETGFGKKQWQQHNDMSNTHICQWMSVGIFILHWFPPIL